MSRCYKFVNVKHWHSIQDPISRGNSPSRVQEVKWAHDIHIQDGLHQKILMGQVRTSNSRSWILELCSSCFEEKHPNSIHPLCHTQCANYGGGCFQRLFASSNLRESFHHLWTRVWNWKHWQEGSHYQVPIWWQMLRKIILAPPQNVHEVPRVRIFACRSIRVDERVCARRWHY